MKSFNPRPAGQHRLGIRCGGYLPIPFTKKTITLSVEAEETIELYVVP